MPELPEVETIRRQLAQVLVGQKIKKIKVLRKKSFKGGALKVEGRKILGVGRRAKMLIVKLQGDLNLLIHLKMTGQLVYKSKAEKPDKHTRVVVEFSKGTLFFNDMRVFGWIKVMDKKGLEREFIKLGPDVNSKDFTVKLLQEILASSGRAVKLILLDQQKLAGVGNIYANDSLYCAQVDPRRPGKEVVSDEKKVKSLFKCLKQVIDKGIKYGGATARDENYVNVKGKTGKYQNHFLVYEKEGKKCNRRGCKGVIKKVKIGGRGTYYCPKCQN